MTTPQLPPGIYNIITVVGGAELYLTRDGKNGVTILSPSPEPDPEQEVIRRFLTSSIFCRSPALLVAN